MEGGLGTFMEVWSLAFASLTYCYFISFNVPKGKFRLISLLPIMYFFVILPLKVTNFLLGGFTAFFLAWLANFKLLLFSFGKGPLCANPSISLSYFISVACLPIMVKEKVITPPPHHIKPTQKLENKPNPSPEISSKTISPLHYILLKLLVLVIVSPIYQYKQHLNSKLMLLYYSFYMYLGLELCLAIFGTIARTLVGIELEPQFNDPYKSSSLQDFWGRRWNLMVTNILRPSIYLPVKKTTVNLLGRTCSSLAAVLCTFLVSGLMHEVVFVYIGRMKPSWEVTCFFVLHGILVILEVTVKNLFKGKWRLHPILSGPITIWIVVVTADWFFFPPLLRSETDVKVSREVSELVAYFKNLGLRSTISP